MAASALKMAYAAYSKGHSALLLAANALAYNSGVLQTLHDEWNLSMPGMVKRSEATARQYHRKPGALLARWSRSVRPSTTKPCQGDFHAGAAQLYAQLSEFKDQPPASLFALLEALNLSSDGFSR
ncbi:MAG: hypothetical protein CM15mP120_17300 [Pseudomonadota bacterium]|nr:MAG: hypothetical protein CM15mP120_17300 [Pseudomonadota bacterium]